MKKLLSVFLLLAAVVFLAPTLTSQEHSSTAVMSLAAPHKPSTGEYTIVGQPTVHSEFINQVLSHSPAAGTGQKLYDLGTQHGIDPVFALAFFLHESDFGTQGEARASLGNLRCIADYPCPDGYAWFPSWEEGYQAWYILIAGPLYVGAGLVTIEQIIPRYAPAADHNDETAYIQDIEHAVDMWRASNVQG